MTLERRLSPYSFLIIMLVVSCQAGQPPAEQNCKIISFATRADYIQVCIQSMDKFMPEALARLGVSSCLSSWNHLTPGDKKLLASNSAVLVETNCRFRDNAKSMDNSAANMSMTGRLDLNRAGASSLTQLPGIGPKLAAKIISWRERRGPFCKPTELTSINGIGPKTFSRLERYVFASCSALLDEL
jgi:competence ComEA-like helix-hairpin-helix protein